MKKFLTVVAVLAVLVGTILAVADRVGAYQAEKQITQRLVSYLESEQMTSSTTPEVTVVGLPFLTQAVSGEYEEIKVSLRDLRGGRLPAPLTAVNVSAKRVLAPLDGILDGNPQVTISEVTGSGSVSYDDVVEVGGLTGFTLSGAGGSKLDVQGQIPILGKVTGSAEVTADGDRIRIRITELKSGNATLTAIAQRLIAQYSSRAFVIEVPGMPFNSRLTGVQADPAALTLTFAANDVQIS